MNIINFTDILVQVGVMVPFIIAAVKGLTMNGFPKKSAFVMDILIGILMSWLSVATHDPKQIILVGIVAGISASGLYAGTKSMVSPAVIE